MRWIDILNEGKKTYYHGSYDKLPVGTLLTSKNNYEDNWKHADFYFPLEKYRPKYMIPHSAAVFLCDNPDDIDLCGGGTDWLFTVEPIGKIEKHDLSWASEISCLIGDYSIDSNEIKEAALNYWNGIEHPNSSVWEFLVNSAIILKVEEY